LAMHRFTALSMLIATALVGSVSPADATISVKDDPNVLNDSIVIQWGGHTFSYLLTGENGIFWSATAYDPDDTTPTALIGQEPKEGSPIKPAVSKIRFEGANVKGNNQPQMVRTKDGYIHAFIGVTYSTDNPNYNYGRIHYYRSDKPEDITNLVDRTELIPTQPYEDYHLRMNVGVSQDGQHVVLVILAISEDGKVPFNTPVMFVGEKQGVDFVFKEPFQYAEPMGFFYPQVAVTNDGIVLVAEMWDKEDIHYTKLLHLDWNYKIIHREDIPVDVAGNHFSYDMRPQNQDDWSKLIIYYNRHPSDNKDNRHEFWRYDTKTMKLELLRSIDTEPGLSNGGKWIPIDKNRSVFINNPSMGQLMTWEGDILGEGEITRTPMDKANPIEMGYQGSVYMFTPNVLQGSIISEGDIYIATEFIGKERKPDKPGPCSFMLWRLDTNR